MQCMLHVIHDAIILLVRMRSCEGVHRGIEPQLSVSLGKFVPSQNDFQRREHSCVATDFHVSRTAAPDT